jgi:hypothetical protein
MNQNQVETKTFHITGGAEVFGKTRSRGKRSQGETKRQRGGDESDRSHELTVQKQQAGGSSNAIIGTGTNIVNGKSVMTAGVLPLATKTIVTGYEAPLRTGAPISGAPVLQGGGSKQVITAPQPQLQQQQQESQTSRKVELRKPAPQHRKVLLNPKKYKIAGENHQHTGGGKSTKTRKARRVTLGITTFHKRLTRAKNIHKDVKELPVEELRKELIKRGLIRESSKAPESVLRQIASDARIVASNGL